jgi:hypothetical protein
MKLLLTVLTLLLFCSCDKDETTGPPVDLPAQTCEISSQKGFTSDADHSALVPYGGGFEKTYSTNGKVQHVRLMSYDWYYRIDSFFYDITYHGNKATITQNTKRYDRPEGTYLVLVDEVESNFEVTFNDSGYASKAGKTTFNYDADNRLISADSMLFVYDQNDNITEVKAGVVELNYTYDLSQTATHQTYITSSGWISNTYNFLEVMEWIPVAPHNLRTSHALITWEDFDEGGPQPAEKEIWETLLFSDHLVQDGVLVSFVVQNDIPDGLIRTISNEIKCTN